MEIQNKGRWWSYKILWSAFLKLLTELKFNKVINNKISNNEWSISVKNKKNNIISITLKYNDKDKFLIFKNGKIFKKLR